MRVKAFQGRTLEEVLPDIRRELGPNAVVLGQRQLVAGGVGGFFGKRMIEVTAADRMPSDDELVELEDRITGGAGSGSFDEARREPAPSGGGLNLTDDWDPATDDELAAEYGSVLRNTGGGVAATAAQRPSAATLPRGGATAPEGDEARIRAALDAAFQAAPADMVATAHERAGQPTGGEGHAPGTYEPLDLPRRDPTITMQPQPEAPAVERRAADAGRPLRVGASVPQGAPAEHPAYATGAYEPPRVQANKLAARAHQAIAEATREIESQVAHARADRAAQPSSTFRAEMAGSSAATGNFPTPSELADRDLGSVRLPDNAPVTQAVLRVEPELAYISESLERELTLAGCDLDVAQAVIRKAITHRRTFSAERDPRTLTRDVIQEILPIETGWTPVGRTHRIAVMGPSGSGTSTVVAKLAEGYQSAGLRVGVVHIATDPDAHHGADPVSRRRVVPVQYASDIDQMLRALDDYANYDLVLFDTPSAAYLDPAAAHRVRTCLGAAGIDESIVTVTLATNVREVESIADHFRTLGANRMVVTKLDESRFAGQLLNFGFRVGLPITYVADGPRVPQDLRAASAREIAELIIPQHTQES